MLSIAGGIILAVIGLILLFAFWEPLLVLTIWLVKAAAVVAVATIGIGGLFLLYFATHSSR